MTRDEILVAAAQIFREKGFEAASMADIAAAVNLQKASLYHHFESKQEILLALLNNALDLLIGRMEGVLALPPPHEEKLRQAMIGYIQTMVDYRDLASVLLLEYRSLQAELRSRHIVRRDAYEQLWRDLIRQGVDAGVFRCADAGLASRALLGVMNWTITWYRPEGPLPATEIARQFADLFLHGLMQAEGA